MQRTFPKILMIGLLMNLPVMCRTAYGQSLADIARENQEKKAAQDASGAKPAKVITNQDLGEGPEGRPDLRAARPSHDWASNRAGEVRGGPGMPDQRAAEQWRRQIEEQKFRIANLQARIDQINASVHPAGGAQYSGPYTRFQARQIDRADQMQRELAEQQRRLEAMQEAARRAGMHTGVYDP
jgi:hypothetical protein